MGKKAMERYKSMEIRPMHKEDLRFAAECTQAEGWVSENIDVLESFFLNDPQGCLVAEENGKRLGICIATDYGQCGFIGELIVRPEARGRGIGAALLNQGVGILETRGAETVYLDGVLKAAALYKRNGFQKICRSWRFSGHLTGKISHRVKQMTTEHLEQVFELDKLHFGADRSFFLKRRFAHFPELCKVCSEGKSITGYIMGRGGETWIAAGPWVRVIDGSNPTELLEALAIEADGRPISLGVLQSNPQACDLARSLGFNARDDSPWRMAKGKPGDLGATPQCMAVGSAAKG
jgi:predicted N-acetyltransferase YhbS